MKIKKTVSIILIISIITTIFVGCNKEEEKQNETTTNNSISTADNETLSICFLMGNTNNVRQASANVIKEELLKASEKKSDYSVIVIDGNPNETSLERELNTSNKLITGGKQNSEQLDEDLENIIHCKPNDEEIDILSALDIAAKTLKTKDTNEKKLVIYSSGISTKGILNFYENPNLLFNSNDEIIKIIKAKHAMPDLSNIEVIWYGLNHVDGEQEKLNSFELYKIRSIWSTILKESGVEFEKDSDVFNEAAAPTIDENEKIDKSSYSIVHSVNFKDIINFTEEEFGFVPNEYTLIDEEKTKAILKPIAEDIINMGYPEFYIIGSTASAKTNEYCLNLSINRAKTIKNILLEFDVPESCLVIYGIGREYIDDDYTWRINDLDNNGNLIPNKAQENRKVMFIPADSNDGRKFKSDFDNYFNR